MLIALYDADKQRKLFRYAGFSALRYAVCECCEVTAMVMCLVLVLCSRLAKEVNSSNCRMLFASSWDGLWSHTCTLIFNPLKPELNPICYLLALLGVHHFLHVSRIRVKLLTFRLLMS